MSTTVSRYLLSALLLFLFAGISARAQFDFTALEGLPTAQTSARASLGDDAYPVLIGAPGNFDFQGFPLRFDLESGRSSVWGYVFYSPSRGEFYSLVVVRVIIYQAIELGALPFPVPLDGVGELNIAGTYADSDDMIVRLESDTAYRQYRSDLPGANPAFLSLSQLLETDSLELPNGFPVGQGTWTVMFQGGGDSTMTCFVASETGEVFCRRIYGLPTSGVNDPADRNTEGAAPTLTVMPNPAGGDVTVSISGKREGDPAESRLLLYNGAGQVVLDLTESLAANGYARATFPASLLPSGLYRCVLVGPWASESVGVVVVE